MAERKGRGALIAAALKKAQESKPGASGDALQQAQEQPPKPRGRAALLEMLKKKTEKKVGEISTPSSSSVSSETYDVSSQITEKTSELQLEEPREYRGEVGSVVPASANYIALKLEPDRGVFEYEVKFEPDVDSKSARFKMLTKVVLEFCKAKTFDGHVLYLPMQFINTRKDFSCEHPFTNEPITMTIIFKKQIRMGDCIHLYNVLFKRIMHALAFSRIGRQFFDNKHPFIIPQHRLEIWPGYVTAVHEYSGGVMLCLDVSHRVLRTQNALEFIYDIIKQNRQRYKQLIEKAFIGTSVLTRYNNKSYIVHDIMWDASPKSKFETTGGGSISFMEYYQRQYNITIKDVDQPMLVNRQAVHIAGKMEKEDRIIMLVPELSFMTGLTDELRSDFKVMKDVAQYTRVTPNQRMNSLRKFISSLTNNKEASDVLGAWGLSLDSATIDLQMRVLEPEVILFGHDVKFHGTMQANWTSAALKNRVLSAVDFNNWLILYTPQDGKFMDDFVQSTLRLGPKMGIHINKPAVYCMPDDRNDTYLKVLEDKINPSLQIICIICPTNRDDRYSTIKRICCSKIPVPSQVINSRTLRNPSKLPAITQKIVLQMNCKLGGTLWSVRFPVKKWMICGIDVYHSTAFSTQAVCGFVSSLTESMSKWYSNSCFHDRDKEIGDHLKPLLAQALQEFLACNGFYPEQIVVFRDGLGDGQLPTCSKFEIPQLLSAIRDIGYPIKLCYVVVQKRINTRIFGYKGNDLENPPPGSIVDHTITKRNMYDFFLVAQHVGQGTVTPTHYIVLHDDANLKPDYVQRLAYKMCHMYYNWTGTVRVPAPCQYAHRLAFLIGQSVRVAPAKSLAHKLFYL